MVNAKIKTQGKNNGYRRPGIMSASEARQYLFPEGLRRSHKLKHEVRPRFDRDPGISRTEYVNISDLKIDYLYQRTDVSSANVHAIARDWNWGVYSPLLVSERSNGDLIIVDGQHRWMAANERGDIRELKCEIHKYDSIEDEAKAFYSSNKMKKSVSAYSTYTARLVFNDPVAVDSKNIAYKYGYSIEKNKSPIGTFCGIGNLMKMVCENRDSADIAFGVCVEIADGEYFDAVLLRGVYFLYNRFKDNPKFIQSDWIKKLSAAGRKICMLEIAKLKSLTGTGGQTVEAKALLDIINKHKRNRFEWSL